MKKIIRNIKLLSIACLTLMAGSCDDILDDDLTDFGNGANFVTFRSASVTAPFVVGAEDQTYQYEVPVYLDGPTSEFETGEIVVSLELDAESSTAVAGQNYDLSQDDLTITLNEGNDFSSSIPVSVYTEGVDPPTVASLAFNITNIEVSGTSADIVINDKKQSTSVNLSYICEADLSGNYLMTSTVRNGVADVEVTIEANDEGGWDVSNLDGAALIATGNGSLSSAGKIFVVCGDVEVQKAAGYCESLGIGCINSGTWDEESGVLTIEYNDSYFGLGDYTATYVRQ